MVSGSSFFIDSVLALDGHDAAPAEWPTVAFPEYADDLLRGFVDHMLTVSDGDLAAGVAVLSGPGLYTLTVAFARAAGIGTVTSDADPRLVAQLPGAVPALLAELCRRDYRGLGDDPTGPLRRGRSLQLVRAFTPLDALGASQLQRQKLHGDCPFCPAEASFQVSLPGVSWRCFACQRFGGLLEFAECLLTKALEDSPAPKLPP